MFTKERNIYLYQNSYYKHEYDFETIYIHILRATKKGQDFTL